MHPRIVSVVIVALAGCAAPSQPASHRSVGADRDAHGCIPSAGYQWCARENACVRPWELAKEKALDRGAPAFEAYCTAR